MAESLDVGAIQSGSGLSVGAVQSSSAATYSATASDSATFTDTASETHKAQVSVSQSATFTTTAVATRFLSGASATGAAFFTDLAKSGIPRSKSATDTATFTGVATSVKSRLRSASDTITFTDTATIKGKVVFASDRAVFTDSAIGGNRLFLPVSASDTATFTTRASVHDDHLYEVGSPDSATFTDVASATKIALASASDSATFSTSLPSHRGRPATASDGATFTDVARSNHFYVASAHDTATFTDTIVHESAGPNASDRMIFTDRADADVLLSSGNTIPGGDTQPGLRTILFGPVSGALPFSYVESSEGYVLIANGIDPVIAWDGTSSEAWQAGIVPPDQVVWLDAQGAGLLTGRRYAFTRWIDARGNPSNFSPISDPIDLGRDGVINNVKYADGAVTVWSRGHGLATGNTVIISGVDDGVPHGVPIVNGTWVITVVDADSFTLNGLHLNAGQYKTGGVWTKGAASIQYSNVQVPGDKKIVRRQILRNLEGDASVFYVDIDTTDLASTSFSSSRTDEDLATSDAVPLQFEDREPNSQRYYPPPSHKRAITAYAGRVWAAADLVYDTGNVAVSLGSRVVQGIGTSWTTSMAGRLLYVDGQPGQAIQAVLTDSQILVLENGYVGPSTPVAFYAIRPAPIERRLVYFSEPGLPEAWPPWNAFALPESSDEIVGLFVLRSYLFVLKERNIYKFLYREDPGADGYVFPVAARGCVNNRCYAQVEGVYYLLDEQGAYAFDGDQATPISNEVSGLFKPDGTSSYRIDWTTDRTLWSCVHDPARQIVRWFVDLVDQPSLTHAICYDYRRQQWWLERFAEGVTSSALAVVGGYRQSVLGTTGRRVFALGQGTLDGIQEDTTGTLRGTATGADSLSLTDNSVAFPSNLAGVPIVIVSGTGAGQVGIISSSTAASVTLVDPWQATPDSSSVYQIGGISWLWRSGWRRYADDESGNPRDVEVVFKPTPTPSSVNARIYYDHADRPATWAMDYGSDGVSVIQDDANLTIDLTESRGYAIIKGDGHRDPYGYGHRYVAVELSGCQGVDPQRIFQVVISGAE